MRSGAAAALRLLETCPLLPADAFVPLVGLRSFSAGYQQLARLRRAGLAEVSGVNLGYLLGDRRVGLWRITAAGIRMLRIAGDGTEAGSLEHGRVLYGAPSNAPRRGRNAGQDLALLVAGYRLLATLVDERCAAGEPVAVQAWERPWVRPLWSPRQAKFVQTRFPAAAVLVPPSVEGGPCEQVTSAIAMLLIPDLGTAPVSRYRNALRRLLALRTVHWESGSTAREPELVIATPDPDGRGTRAGAWAELLHRVARRQGEPILRARILGWESVAQVVGRQRIAGLVAGESGLARRATDNRSSVRRWPSAMRGAEQVLQVVGRHPFLTANQRVDLLGTTAKRLGALERQLADRGWLRCVSSDELSADAIGLNGKERRALRLVEITPAGRRRLAEWLALDTATASRYHGLIDSGRGQARRRARLFRALPHTLGVNAVFVAMSVVAHTAARQGGADELVEWRSAAACERRRCKPDGYGCYRRNGVGYGFLLEYDRGTEPARRYAAKFGAYYRYRDSGDAARDFDGFPTLLFVTTDPAAETRIADQAFRAWLTRATEPLPILITTTDRIVGHREGILGPIWRTPDPMRARVGAHAATGFREDHRGVCSELVGSRCKRRD